MDSRSPTADAGSGRVGTSPAEFEQALREATTSMQSHGFGPRTALIPELRRALGRQVSREEFDRGLRRLRHEAIVELAAHGHPELLSPSEIQDALPEGPSVLYLLRWLR